MKQTKLIVIVFLNIVTCMGFKDGYTQETIKVGDTRIKYQPSPTAERKYVQYLETASGSIQFNTLLTRRIQRIEVNNVKGLLVTQTYQSAKGVDFDSSFCDLITLAPIFYRTHIMTEGHRENVTFAKDKITNTTTFKDSSQQVDKENPGYFNGVMTDELISALPLRDKASFVFNTVNPGLRFYPYITKVVVDGKETIQVADQKIQCWRIRLNQGGPSDSIEWYSVETRIQVMKRFELPNGSKFIRVLVAG